MNGSKAIWHTGIKPSELLHGFKHYLLVSKRRKMLNSVKVLIALFSVMPQPVFEMEYVLQGDFFIG